MGAATFGHARIINMLGGHSHVLADFDVNVGVSSSLSQGTASFWNDVRGSSGFSPQLSSSWGGVGAIFYDTGSNQLTNQSSGSMQFRSTVGGQWSPVNPLSLCVFSTIPAQTQSVWAAVIDSINADSYVSLQTGVNSGQAPVIQVLSGFSDTIAATSIGWQTYTGSYRTVIGCCGTGSGMGTTGSAVYVPDQTQITNTAGYTINESLNSTLVLFNLWAAAKLGNGQESPPQISMRGVMVMDHVVNYGESLYLGMFGAARYGCMHL